MATSKAQQRAVAKYNEKTYDQITTRIPKGKREAIEEAAKKLGVSVNGFVTKAIEQALKYNDSVYNIRNESLYKDKKSVTNADKRKANEPQAPVANALIDGEQLTAKQKEAWQAILMAPKKSARELAKETGLGKTTISETRKKMLETGALGS